MSAGAAYVRWVIGCGLLFGLLCGAKRARAEGDDAAAAQGLFDEAKALMAKGKYAQACPMLEESQRLDPGLGTTFKLAECNEKTGRIATAWSGFLEVASRARSAGRSDAEKVARERAEALQPKLPKLVVQVPVAAQTSGLEVKRDGQRVGQAQWGIALPVDPGEHEVSVTAPRRKSWQTKVTATLSRETRTIVPVLEVSDEPEPATTPAEEPPAADAPPPAQKTAPVEQPPAADGSGQRTLGLIIGGVGVAALGGSVALGAMAKSQYDGVSCPKNECSRAAGTERDSAETKATIATIVGGVGAAALVGGVVLFLVAPSKKEASAARRELSVGVLPGGLVLRGTL